MNFCQRIFFLLFVLSLSGCSYLFYFPHKEQIRKPSDFKYIYEEFRFKSKDQTPLHAWKIFAQKVKQPLGTIIFFHGNAENISTHFFNLAWITEHGYDLFIFDYRGYGKSAGEPDQNGTYLDGIAAMEEGMKWSEIRKSKKIIVYGQSLGGIIAARSLIDFKHKDKISLLVLDSTFSSYQDIAFDKLTNHWLTFLFSPLAYLLVSDEMESQSYLPNDKTPKLIIHGVNDTIVPYKFGEEIFHLSSEPKWLWKIENSKHIDAFFKNSGEYKTKFLHFLSQIK
ncbi:MAG: alpha/beta hydrolase [Bacteriovoracaceae bacterium]|nr:alpha/beta hydrolase [Bacteriovoracaceae bacterium]